MQIRCADEAIGPYDPAQGGSPIQSGRRQTMALFGLTGVHLDEEGRILRARLQEADGATRTWLGDPFECDAREVANLIAIGNVIYAVFIVLGRTVLGQRFRVVADPDGNEGIELESNGPGLGTRDLLLF